MAATMPAMPAPSTSTDVPGAGGDSLIGPLKVEVSARASSVMAWYMAALPATTPIMLRRERLVGAIGWAVILSPRNKSWPLARQTPVPTWRHPSSRVCFDAWDRDSIPDPQRDLSGV